MDSPESTSHCLETRFSWEASLDISIDSKYVCGDRAQDLTTGLIFCVQLKETRSGAKKNKSGFGKIGPTLATSAADHRFRNTGSP